MLFKLKKSEKKKSHKIIHIKTRYKKNEIKNKFSYLPGRGMVVNKQTTVLGGSGPLHSGVRKPLVLSPLAG